MGLGAHDSSQSSRHLGSLPRKAASGGRESQPPFFGGIGLHPWTRQGGRELAAARVVGGGGEVWLGRECWVKAVLECTG